MTTIQKKPKQCLENIKRKTTEKTGITKFIDIDETSAAFSKNHALQISLGVTKKRKTEYLYVFFEDHFEWFEYDYKSQEDFENAVVEYICEHMNRTIKTITEMKRHKYIRVTTFYLDKKTGKWKLMSDDKMSWLFVRPFITEDILEERTIDYSLV